jgi:hypothetical protein
MMQQRPLIVCLCGSTRFMETFHEVAARETLAQKIVVAPACVTTQAGQEIEPTTKAMLDELHKRKIDLADEVLIVNVDGYIGQSTRSEIAYAQQQNKCIRWLERSTTLLICEERHPLKAGASIFRTYTETLQPLFIEGETLQEVVTTLRRGEQGYSLTILSQPELLKEA